MYHWIQFAYNVFRVSGINVHERDKLSCPSVVMCADYEVNAASVVTFSLVLSSLEDIVLSLSCLFL